MSRCRSLSALIPGRRGTRLAAFRPSQVLDHDLTLILGQKGVDDFAVHVGESAIDSVVAKGQAFVVDAQQM